MKKQFFKIKSKYLSSFFLLIFFQVSMYSQTNLILDSGFENGSTAWVIWGGAIRAKAEVKSGIYAINAPDNSAADQIITGLTPNTTYILSGWLKSSNNSQVILGVKWYGGNELTAQTTSSTFEQLSVQFTTGPASTTAFIYVYNPSGGSNTMTADDLSLTYSMKTPYRLVWSDEFNGNGSVNASNWSFENGFVRNEEEQWYQSGNAIQEGGNLIIEGRIENPINKRLNPNYNSTSTDWRKSRQFINYTSSSVNTAGKQSWLYGRFEIRAKITNLVGTWPAIWTLGDNCEWPSGGEIDIMENYGGNVLANFAWGTNTRWNAKWDSSQKNVISNFVNNDPDWLTKFHIWTLDWDENKMSIYIDDVLLNEIDLSSTLNGSANCSGENPFKKKQYLLLNLALGGGGGSVSNLSFPTQYIIDYVRVYQLDANLAVNKVEKQGTFKVYPNPAKSVVNIDYDNNKSNFQLFDVSGKVVIKGSGAKVDLSELKKGIYFVKVEDLKTIRIIKE